MSGASGYLCRQVHERLISGIPRAPGSAPLCAIDELEEGDISSHMAITYVYCYECQRKIVNFKEHRMECHYQCQQYYEEFDTENNLTIVSHVLKISQDKKLLSIIVQALSAGGAVAWSRCLAGSMQIEL